MDPGCLRFVLCLFLGMWCDCSSCNVFHRRREQVSLRKLFKRNAFWERLPRAEWDDPFETTFWSLGNVVPRGYISWTTKDQDEGVEHRSRVDSRFSVGHHDMCNFFPLFPHTHPEHTHTYSITHFTDTPSTHTRHMLHCTTQHLLGLFLGINFRLHKFTLHGIIFVGTISEYITFTLLAHIFGINYVNLTRTNAPCHREIYFHLDIGNITTLSKN